MATSSSPRSLRLTHLGTWKIEKHLASGGFGDVYLCERKTVSGERQTAAVKIVNPARESAQSDGAFLRKEFDLLKRVSSPYVAPVIDSGLQELTVGRSVVEVPWMAVEYIPGRSLQEEVSAEGVLNEAEWLDLAHDLLSAVAATHEVGLVNSDIKPTNIMRSSRKTMIIDLGGAAVYGVRESDSPSVYSFGYASPEQLDRNKPKPLGYESDLFSIGATLVFAATGLTPWNFPESPRIKDPRARQQEMLSQAVTIITTQKPRLEGLSEMQKDLVKKLIDVEPRMRLSAADALSQVRSAMAPGNPRKTGDVTFDRVRSVAQWVRPKEPKKPRAQSRLNGFFTQPSPTSQPQEAAVSAKSEKSNGPRIVVFHTPGSRVRPEPGVPVVARMLTTVFLSVLVPIIGPASRFFFLEHEQRPDYPSRIERNIAASFFSWGTIGIGGAFIAKRWYSSTKKRIHLIIGAISIAGPVLFFAGLPVTTLSESVGAAISSIGLLGILITPLVQVSKAPWPGEEAAAAEDSATDAKESE
jgi:serine/threonine protein kinase